MDFTRRILQAKFTCRILCKKSRILYVNFACKILRVKYSVVDSTFYT